MDQATAQTVGTIAGAFAASFTAQLWGNFVTRKAARKVISGTAAQSTVNDIKAAVLPTQKNVETLVKQPGVVKTEDDRSPTEGKNHD